MSSLAYFRRRQRRFARLAMVLCATVWLNMALQPCLMALELPGAHHSDCPHCPDRNGADHCDTGAGGRCAYIDVLDYDGRTLPPPTADFHDSFVIVVQVGAPLAGRFLRPRDACSWNTVCC